MTFRMSLECHRRSPVRQILSVLGPIKELLTRMCRRTGFLRQWPSLPHFGIFLTVFVLPVAHVEDADRYVVGRINSLPGFYGVAQYLGFRDTQEVHINEIVTKISELETRLGPRGALRIVSQLVDQSHQPTHVYALPHFSCGNMH